VRLTTDVEHILFSSKLYHISYSLPHNATLRVYAYYTALCAAFPFLPAWRGSSYVARRTTVGGRLPDLRLSFLRSRAVWTAFGRGADETGWRLFPRCDLQTAALQHHAAFRHHAFRWLPGTNRLKPPRRTALATACGCAFAAFPGHFACCGLFWLEAFVTPVRLLPRDLPPGHKFSISATQTTSTIYFFAVVPKICWHRHASPGQRLGMNSFWLFYNSALPGISPPTGHSEQYR
jgi:hypothetical protein